jgi:magnesium transporter
VAHQFQISCTVGITLVIVVTLGCVVGSGMPMLLKRLGFDPAVSSTPFIASLVDVLGIVAYFNVAKMVLGAIIH